MAEEAVIEVPTPEEVVAAEAVEPEAAPELSKAEEEAYGHGWRPEAEYEGDGIWIGADEFLARAPLYEGLSKANKEIKRMKATMKQFADHNKQVEKAAFEKAKAELKQDRAEALREEDFEKAVDLEDRARELEKTQTQEPSLSEEFVKWSEDNDWYGSNINATVFADAMGPRIREAQPDLSEAELYAEVTKQVKAAFPADFKKPLPNRGNPSGAQGGGKQVGKNKFGLMTPDQQKLCRELVAMGALTEPEYIKQLEESGILGKE